MSIRILADENIPLAREVFGLLGEVELRAGRDLKSGDLHNADALIVRSVTKVNEALLADSPVRFIGTATIGTDHLSIPEIEKLGIRWCSAAGSNARSVVEWVIAALSEFHQGDWRYWKGKTIGIVGDGNIGSRLASVAENIGMRVLRCDPPKARNLSSFDHSVYTDLNHVYTHADYLSFHVPLIKAGPDRTVHLLDQTTVSLLKKDAVILNASRGEVIETEAALIAENPLMLDVFEGEPRPNRDLIARCHFATPHIAGYSREGKLTGTLMIASELARHLCVALPNLDHLLETTPRTISVDGLAAPEALLAAIRSSYAIAEDDRRLRSGLELSEEAWGKHFDQLRRDYPERREFATVQVCGAKDPALRGLLRALSFQVVE